MLDKKQTWVILFEFKMGVKAAETIHNIDNTFVLRTANECTLQSWFKKFCKRDKSFEDEQHSGQPSEVDSDQLRAFIEADPLITAWKVAEELNVKHLKHLKQIGKVKKLDKWVPQELTANQKINYCSKVLSSLIVCNNSELFLDWIAPCEEKQIFYDNQRQPARWLDQEEAPKNFPKPNLHPKKVMVSVWWSDSALIHYSFLNHGETIHLRSMLSKSVRCTKNCNTYNRHWSAERAQFFSKCQSTQNTTKASRVEQIGLQSFASSPIFTWLLSNWLPLLQASWQLFTAKMLSQPVWGRQCFPRVHRVLKHRFLRY